MSMLTAGFVLGRIFRGMGQVLDIGGRLSLPKKKHNTYMQAIGRDFERVGDRLRDAMDSFPEIIVHDKGSGRN